MAKVPVPERGQPLDVSYLYQLSQAVNDLSDQLSPVTAKYTTVDTINNGTQSVRTSDSRIVGGFVNIINSASNSAGVEQEFSYQFTDFAYPPVVTATPKITDAASTQASKDVSVTITNVTTGGVSGVVKFNTPGVASIGIYLIIVGIPV